MSERKTPAEWADQLGIVVYDADGFRDYPGQWDTEKMERWEFDRRVLLCSVAMIKPSNEQVCALCDDTLPIKRFWLVTLPGWVCPTCWENGNE